MTDVYQLARFLEYGQSFDTQIESLVHTPIAFGGLALDEQSFDRISTKNFL